MQNLQTSAQADVQAAQEAPRLCCPRGPVIDWAEALLGIMAERDRLRDALDRHESAIVALAALVDRAPPNGRETPARKAVKPPKHPLHPKGEKVKPGTRAAVAAKVRALAAQGGLSMNQIAAKAGCSWKTAEKYAKGVKAAGGNGAKSDPMAIPAPAKRPYV